MNKRKGVIKSFSSAVTSVCSVVETTADAMNNLAMAGNYASREMKLSSAMDLAYFAKSIEVDAEGIQRAKQLEQLLEGL